MRMVWLKVVASSSLLSLVVAGTAWAHVVVSPEQVPAEEFETFTVSVPTEKEVPTTQIRVEIPEGFTVSGVQPVPGWDYAFEEEGGVITSITWSGGELKPREFQQFLISAQAPDNPGEYPWRAFQTYQDGSVVEWAGPPEAEEPASVVQVVSGGSATDERSGAESDSQQGTASVSGTLPDSGGTGAVLYGGVAALVLGLGAGMAALLRRRV